MRALLLVAAAAWVVLNGINALHKGGDFSVYLDAGTRFLQGKPLYEASGIAAGLVGPPFQPVLFAPFALLAATGVEAARVGWYLFNVVCLAVGLYAWHHALTPLRPPQTSGSPSTFVWPLLAVMYPLQTNFEHQNINAVLLAFVGLGAWRESQGRNRGAGLWLGAAAALKVFPLLLLAVLAARRCWRTLAWACSTAVLLTLLPVLRYGAQDYLNLIRDWWSLSGQGHWPIRRHNQSLFAMLGRYGSPADLFTWGPIPETASPGVHLVWLVIALALAALFLWIVARMTGPTRPEATTVALAAGVCVAVLLSPIAWEHYWLLLWPVFAVAYNAPAGSPRWVRLAFWAGAFLTSGIARPTAGRLGVALARGLSVRTWGGAMVLIASLAVFRTLQQRGTDYHVRTT